MHSYSNSISISSGKASLFSGSRHALITVPPLRLLNAVVTHDSPGLRKAFGTRSQQCPPYFSQRAFPSIPLRLKESTRLIFHCVVVLARRLRLPFLMTGIMPV